MKTKPKTCFPCVLLAFLTLQVNVLAPFCVIHTFLPDLIDQKVSNIVNISSLIAFLPSSRLSFFSFFFVDSQCVQRIESRALRDEQLSAIRNEGEPLRSYPRFHGVSAVRDHGNVRRSVSERVGAEMFFDVQTSRSLHQGMRVSG